MAKAVDASVRTRPRTGAGRVPGPWGWLRRLVVAALAAALLWLAAVLALGLAYNAVMPVSTLMIGRWATLRPVAREAVPLDRISPELPRAVLTSEDQRFCAHAGVDWEELRTVIDDAEDGLPSRGASTLTMQVAKNLFLWPSRSYLRKGLEFPLALYLDFVLPKRRLMEIYLNIAEWGEGVFGAEAAAQLYFNKPAKALTRREAALLASALPNPLKRNAGRPSGGHRSLAGKLSGKMGAAGDLGTCLRG